MWYVSYFDVLTCCESSKCDKNSLDYFRLRLFLEMFSREMRSVQNTPFTTNYKLQLVVVFAIREVFLIHLIRVNHIMSVKRDGSLVVQIFLRIVDWSCLNKIIYNCLRVKTILTFTTERKWGYPSKLTLGYPSKLTLGYPSKFRFPCNDCTIYICLEYKCIWIERE